MAESLAECAGVPPGVQLDIHKHIPVAGGLAGGSADAAASLVACDALWGTALGTGRGERLPPVMVGGTFHWVVALADGGLSTPVVYAELDRLRRGRRVPRPAVGHDILTAVRAARSRRSRRRCATTSSWGVRPRAVPADGHSRRAWALARSRRKVSGSGPSCVLLARDDEHAAVVADALAATAVCAAVQVAIGPTPSAPHHRRAARSIVDAG